MVGIHQSSVVVHVNISIKQHTKEKPMNLLETWINIHSNLLKQIIPLLFVLSILYILLCLTLPFMFIFVSLLYILTCGIIREIYWLSDYYTSLVFGYDTMQKYLWGHIHKPPRFKTKLRMYFFWLIVFKPAWECRVRRLKRMHKGDVANG